MKSLSCVRLFDLIKGGFPGGSVVKNPPANAGDTVWSLCWEDPLEKKRATHSGTLAWEIPWTEGPGELSSMGSQESDMIWWLNNKNCRLVYYTSQRRYRDDSVLVFNTLRIELSLVNFCIFLKKKFQKKHAYLFVHLFTKQITFKCLLCTKHCSDVTGYKHWKITAPALLAQACSAPLPVKSLHVSSLQHQIMTTPGKYCPTAPESVAPSILPSLLLFISLGLMMYAFQAEKACFL